MSQITDDAFELYAREQERIAKEEQRRPSAGSSSYVEVKYTGLETNRAKILRAVGGPPDSNLDVFTARTTRIAWIVGDDKKKFRCILPEAADAPDHLLWNIISRVKRSEWIDGKRSYPVSEKYPEIFNLVEKNGLDTKDRSFIFDRGWTGRSVLLMNVIDREQMDWHREHKHTMLLSRSIGLGKDGTEFPEIGVPSYGFSSLLGNLFKFYKSWEKYDIGITRTGLKESPYRIINASKYLEEVPDDLKEFVVDGPLTDEERAYEAYDLQKLFQYTTYTKIYNHLKGKIARIDATLDTNFLDELKFLVEKEKKERADSSEDSEDAPEVAPVKESAAHTHVEVVSKPVRSRSVVAGNDFSKLPGWKGLTEKEKANIVDVDFTITPVKISFDINNPENETLLACPECSTPGPEYFSSCPSCGTKF